MSFDNPQSCDNTVDSNQVNSSYGSEYQSFNWQQQQQPQQNQPHTQQSQSLNYPYQSDHTPMKLWNQSYTHSNYKPNPFQPLAKDAQEESDVYFERRPSIQYSTNKYLKNNMLSAPSYVPYGNRFPMTPNSVTKAADDDDLKEEVQKLKNELILKNQMIKNLTDQINVMIKNKNNRGYYETKEDDTRSYKLPQNHYQLFQDLSKTLQEKCQELDDANQRMEIILVANHHTGYDVEELSHKLLYKMNQLQTENDELVKMVSMSNKSSLLVEIGMLKQQVAELKEKSK
ncbi:MUM2 [Candida metapsilosis]|uniref:MUM2 n=1 Tax=Candida metapsilosis TaxID=273372 RepID=A0A8H8D964_9ASCO|nr:MUM2 [Candida metapsilosis]